MPDILNTQQLAILKNSDNTAETEKSLRQFSLYRLKHVSIIKEYHELLLFLRAFPPNKPIYQLAISELTRIAGKIRNANAATKHSMMASGIANSELLCSYSSEITKWLAGKFPGDIALEGSDAENDTVIAVLQTLSPSIEFEKITQGNLSLLSRLKKITGLQNSRELLKWLLLLFNDSSLPACIKEELYQQLKVFVRWKLNDELFNRSFLCLPVQKTYFQKKIIRQVNAVAIINKHLDKPLQLSAAAKINLLDTMKASLAFMYRETDPVTYADEDELKLFDIGRGMQIALVGMKKEKRLALESYVGFMAFKNGIPVSYGGGWLWGHQCRIGINIYPAFRRGESAWLFCQVMRVYHQYLRAGHFIVKPYQYGHKNPEGLKSGAFWFYYKLGFRPVKDTIRKEAAAEWEKIKELNNYRTPMKLMKHFTTCNIEWVAKKDGLQIITASVVSSAISKMINEAYKSSRSEAISSCTDKMRIHLPAFSSLQKKSNNSEVCNNWSLLNGLMNDLDKWKPKQKNDFIKLIRLKQQGSERDYIISLQKNIHLWKALEKAIAAN